MLLVFSLGREFLAQGLMIFAVLANYLFKLANVDSTAWMQKGVAVAAYTVAVLCQLSQDYLP